MIKTIYSVWLYDKDTKTQLWTNENALQFITSKVVECFWIGTITLGQWVYTHDDGQLVIEPSIIVSIITDEQPKDDEFIKTIKTTLNQESIMKEQNTLQVNFL